MYKKPHYINKVFVSPENKFVYFFFEKTASMSFRHSGLFGKKPELKSYPLEFKPKDSINIAIFRNPTLRVISSYLWIVKMNKQNSLSISTGGFENFLGLLEQGYIGSDVLKGTTTQVDSLRSRGVTLDDIDVKILFENLSVDFENFKNKYNLPHINLHWRNESDTNEKKELFSLINNNSSFADRIKNIYASDFALYGKVCKMDNRI